MNDRDCTVPMQVDGVPCCVVLPNDSQRKKECVSFLLVCYVRLLNVYGIYVMCILKKIFVFILFFF